MIMSLGALRKFLPGAPQSPGSFWLMLGVMFLAARVQATEPRLRSILPAGGQLGTELEVSFEGDRLQDSEEIFAYEPGLKVLKLNLVTNKVVKAQLKIEPDCRLGEHHFRVRTSSGWSDLMTFFVSPYPSVAEVEPNNDPQKAQAVELNTTISGTLVNEDVDCFAIEAKKGQRISAEVEAMRLGRAALDTRLSIYGLKGALVADADDTWLGMQDPFVSFVVPADGRYVLQVREITYGGSDKSYYRLHVGTFARPVSIYPLGGKTGETISFKLFSPATGEFTNQVKLPDVPQEKFGIFAEFEGLKTPSPNWIRVSSFPNVLAVKPNDSREHATPTDLPMPLALNGILAEKHAEDWFRLPLTKGTAVEFNVFARRLRSPVDSVLEVFDSAGKSLGSNDDTAGADSSLKITPSETTNYFVRIQDRLGNGGPDFAYRIEVTPSRPEIAVKIPEVSRNETQSRQFIQVPRGNRFVTLISAKRSNLGSAIEFDLPALPAGVHMSCDHMAANMDSMPLVFEAAADAPISGALLDLVASGTNAEGAVTGRFKQEIELVPGPNNTSFYGTSVDKLSVAVVKEAPFKLRVIEPKVPLVQSGSARLEIVAERNPGFDEPIEVNMVWNPPGISSQSEATIPKGATNVFYQLNAGGGAETRTWKIAFFGQATVEEGKVYVSTQLSPIEVASPFLTGKIETTWVNPGKAAKMTVNLQQSKPFEGKASIKLMGLPEKITTSDKEITKDDQEVVFDLNVDPACSTGSHKNLFCAVDVKQNGEIITHSIASGGILRIVPPKKDDAKIAAVEKK
jgi:hypothetical protein